MCCSLPVLSKCCCCVPLRTGLIVWGYFRLIIAVLYLVIILHEVGTQFSAKGFAILLALLSFLVANVVFSVLFVIGAHRKNYKLLRIYYSFNIFALFVAVIAYLILILLQLTLSLSYEEEWYTLGVSSLAVDVTIFASIVLDIYFIILIRSEILKLKNSRVYFVARTQGTNVVLDLPIQAEQDKKCDVYTDSDSEEEVALNRPLFPVQELEILKKDLENRRI